MDYLWSFFSQGGMHRPAERYVKGRLIAALMLALTMSFSAVAFAQITEGPGKGNPETNPSGKCPAGQNKETSPGGLLISA
jgi:hypothetical protein